MEPQPSGRRNRFEPPLPRRRVRLEENEESRPIQRSACDSIMSSAVSGVLKDLGLWQTLGDTMTLKELEEKITSSNWLEDILSAFKESVIFVTGAPNSGKSTLAVNVWKCLGLTKTQTTSKNFWLFTRSERPYFSIWVYCNDSFYDGGDFNWSRMQQSVAVIRSREEFQSGAVLVEGLSYPDYDVLATSTVVIASTEAVLRQRNTAVESIRKHKLYISGLLWKIEDLRSYGIFPADSTPVHLANQLLQLVVLDDANLDTRHLRLDLLDGRWCS